MQSPRYRNLLRTLFGLVVRSDLGGTDLRVLADELRRGQLPDELAYMLDKVAPHFGDPAREVSKELRELERLIRDKNISKSTLSNIMTSMDSAPVRGATVRRMLQDFLGTSSAHQIDKLRDTLMSMTGPDPFLKGIAESKDR
jgi:hypothetical protein